VNSHVNNSGKDYGSNLAREIDKPLKDKLLLQGLKRGNFKRLSPHSHTSILLGPSKKCEGDVEMKELQGRRDPDLYS
jgi:hypothetical protein